MQRSSSKENPSPELSREASLDLEMKDEPRSIGIHSLPERRRAGSFPHGLNDPENESLIRSRNLRQCATESELRNHFDKDYAGEGGFKHATLHDEARYWCWALLKKGRTTLSTPINWEERLPVIKLVRGYSCSFLSADGTAGLAVGIMAVPQGLSYAMLANLPPIYGLYCGLIYPLIYLLFGSSRELSVGVSAIEALLTAEAVASVVGWIDSEDNGEDPELVAMKVRVSIALSLIVGLLHFLMRLMKLGALSALLADPVLSGFSSASAFLIGTSQLKHLFGVTVAKSDYTPVIWADLLIKIPKMNVASFLIGSLGIVFLVLMKKVNGKYFKKFPLPAPLLLVIIGSLVTWLGGLADDPFNVKILGHIPEGPPMPMLPSFGDASIGKMIQAAFTLAMITYIMSISIAKTIANQNDYAVNADQELFALGACNLVGSLFQCFPAAASLSRTAVVSSIGGKTSVHNIVGAAIMMLTLVAITPALFYLPKAVLASVVLHGVYKMIAFGEAKNFLSTHRPDFFLWCVSFLVTVCFGAIYGIVASVGVSLIWLLKKISLPSTAVLGRLPGTMVYRNVRRFPIAQEFPGIQIFRFDAPLHFANKDFFESKVKTIAKKKWTHTIIIDASSINDLDSSAVRMLVSLVKKLETESLQLLFANWKGPQRDFLDQTGFHNVVPTKNLFLSLHDAVLHARDTQNRNQGSYLDPELQEESRIQDPVPVAEVTPHGTEKKWTLHGDIIARNNLDDDDTLRPNI